MEIIPVSHCNQCRLHGDDDISFCKATLPEWFGTFDHLARNQSHPWLVK
ncbi:hypothetical protein LSH36_634g01000 [Paralvinella palmiformis]|uniref:Uncharacterized protein n=1 Tax=Paralvinella palmiformis TaxID=53620 RepID=A0AAD9J5L7_9ANNE|nr:hypothetical protein LSH36_634g01000 [Paralvinella palmiformis]